MPLQLHPAYPDFHGGAILAPPAPRTSGLYQAMTDPFSLPIEGRRLDLRQYVTVDGRQTGQSLAIPVRNQGRYGACTGFMGSAIRGALTVRDQLEKGLPPDIGDTPSARYAYLRARQLDGSGTADVGASMESACRVYPTFGVAPARFDKWDDAKAAAGDLTWLNHTPTQEAEDGAQFFGAAGFNRLSGQGMSLIASIVQCINDGYPAGIAFGVPQSYLNTRSNGKVVVPGASERSEGGHTTAAFAIFFDNSAPGGGWILHQGSWSLMWGEDGWGYMPFAWATSQIRVGPDAGRYWLGEAWTIR